MPVTLRQPMFGLDKGDEFTAEEGFEANELWALENGYAVQEGYSAETEPNTGAKFVYAVEADVADYHAPGTGDGNFPEWDLSMASFPGVLPDVPDPVDEPPAYPTGDGAFPDVDPDTRKGGEGVTGVSGIPGEDPEGEGDPEGEDPEGEGPPVEP